MIATINFFTEMFSYGFMRNAFYAGTTIAIVSAIVGYFVVIRGLAFASHSLGHIGFAGAAGAGLIGLTPPVGQLLFTMIAAIGMGTFSEKIERSDTVIGIMLAFFLGLGVLFLYFYTNYAGNVMSILFGDILGVSPYLLNLIFISSLVTLVTLSFIARPLLFASIEPALAEAKGISLRLMSILFLCITAVAVTEASQIVGILLVFTLIVGPAATAINIARGFWQGMLLSIMFALLTVWCGVLLTYLTDWPSAFWISFISLILYLLSLLYTWKK